MGFVKFYGQQFVLAVLVLLLYAALATGAATPALELAGRAADAGPLGLTLPALLGFLPPIAALWWGPLRYEGLPGRPSEQTDRRSDMLSWLAVVITAALFIVGTSLELAAPSRWHAAYTASLTRTLSSSTPGVTELAAIGTMLAPLLVGNFLLQLATLRVPKHRDEVLYGRTWPWVVAGLLLLGGVAGVFWLLR